MITNYYKHYSNFLSRDMEYKTYGTEGRPVLVFPSQNGRFFDYENFDMTNTLSQFIDAGQIRLICIDSIDSETWSNQDGDPHSRLEQHERWYNYIIEELIPAVRKGEETFIVTGCSMGAFHSALFFFRRPDIFDTVIALSGLYNANYFIPGYCDELLYNNSVLHFLPNMPEGHPYLDIYRNRQIIFCVGQGRWEEDLIESTRRLEAVLADKNIPALVDYWGYDVDHDWPWWRKQLYYFMSKVVG